jgi:hypothetical protein
MKTLAKAVLTLLVLAGSFALSAPQHAAAQTCPTGSLPGHIYIFYSDATYTTIVCRTADCGGTDACHNPTPYFTTTDICCRPRGN